MCEGKSAGLPCSLEASTTADHTHVDSGALVLVSNAHSAPTSCDPGACANSVLYHSLKLNH